MKHGAGRSQRDPDGLLGLAWVSNRVLPLGLSGWRCGAAEDAQGSDPALRRQCDAEV